MKDVIFELEEQLRFAESEDERFAAQLKKAITILKEHEEEVAND
jgi:hypothetical protein